MKGSVPMHFTVNNFDRNEEHRPLYFVINRFPSMFTSKSRSLLWCVRRTFFFR